MNLLDFIILALATWRLTSLVIYETGPFRVFAHIRRLVRADRPGELSGLAELFSCVWCMSVWIGGLCVLLFVLDDDVARWLLAISALSAIAIAINDRLHYP